MLRRAYKTASTAPGGPVYLAVSQPALEAKNQQAQILPGERFLIQFAPAAGSRGGRTVRQMVDRGKASSAGGGG